MHAGYEYDGGIIITASHLPFNRNGFKFFTKEGGLEKGNIKDILQKAAAAAHAAGITPHARHTDDALVLDAALNTDPSSAQHVSPAQKHCIDYFTCSALANFLKSDTPSGVFPRRSCLVAFRRMARMQAGSKARLAYTNGVQNGLQLSCAVLLC